MDPPWRGREHLALLVTATQYLCVPSPSIFSPFPYPPGAIWIWVARNAVGKGCHCNILVFSPHWRGHKLYSLWASLVQGEEKCQVTAQLYRPVNAAQLSSLHKQSCCSVWQDHLSSGCLMSPIRNLQRSKRAVVEMASKERRGRGWIRSQFSSLLIASSLSEFNCCGSACLCKTHPLFLPSFQRVDEWMAKEGLLDPSVKSIFVTCGDWDLKVMWVWEGREIFLGFIAPCLPVVQMSLSLQDSSCP